MFDALMLAALRRLGDEFDVHPAALAAVIETESAGKVFAKVYGRDEPLIRFEGHYFDKRLSGEARDLARAKGLANPKAGAVKNPASQQARWDRLLTPAMLLDTQAALESTSWGVGQVMGAHWKALGFSSVLALRDEARSSFEGQARLMLRFIRHNGLVAVLKRRDWAAFARAYNGPGYKKNRYDEKMAEAFAKWQKAFAAPPARVDAPKADLPAKSQEPAQRPALPESGPIQPPKGWLAGIAAAVLVSTAGMFWAAACSMPDFIIDLLGYAAKCAGGN